MLFNVGFNQHEITTATFQNPINLYLYLPSLSAHPPNCLKWLIVSTILCYHEQNDDNDFIKFTTAFIQQSHNRGHDIESLIPHLQHAGNLIDQWNKTLQPYYPSTPKDSTTLYIHWDYHLKGLQLKQICQIYNNILYGNDNFSNMTISLSCPKNLWDMIAKQDFQNYQDKEPLDFLPTPNLWHLPLKSANNAPSSMQISTLHFYKHLHSTYHM